MVSACGLCLRGNLLQIPGVVKNLHFSNNMMPRVLTKGMQIGAVSTPKDNGSRRLKAKNVLQTLGF